MEPEALSKRILKLIPSQLPFRRLLETQALHAGGDALVAVALVDTLFFDVPLGEARDKVALYLLLTMAPFAVLSPLVGPLLDRFRGSYRIALVASATGRALLALLLSTRTDRLWLYPLAFGTLVLSRIHGVSRSALVPDVRPEDKTLMWANAWTTIASVAGALVLVIPGALLNTWPGPGATLKLSMVVFAAGAFIASRLPATQGIGRRDERVHDFRALLSPRILAGGVAAAATRAAVGFIVFFFAFVLRARDEAGFGFALVVAAGTVGGVLAALVTPPLRRRLHESALLVIAPLAGAGFALWGVAGFSLAKAAVVGGVMGLSAGMARLAFDSLLQQYAPEHVRGRTFARYETIFQVFWVGGAGLATAVPFGAENGLRAMAAICFAGVVASFWRFLRHERNPQQTETTNE